MTVPVIKREHLFGNPERLRYQISPDGKKLSWLAPVNDVLNIFVSDIENPDAAE